MTADDVQTEFAYIENVVVCNVDFNQREQDCFNLRSLSKFISLLISMELLTSQRGLRGFQAASTLHYGMVGKTGVHEVVKLTIARWQDFHITGVFADHGRDQQCMSKLGLNKARIRLSFSLRKSVCVQALI